MKDLEFLKGKVWGSRFVLRKIGKRRVREVYKLDGLRTIANAIDDKAFIYQYGKRKQIKIEEDEAVKMKKDLNRIIEAIEN